MKNNYINLIVFFVACAFVVTSCDEADEVKSIAKPTAIPFIDQVFLEPAYVYGFGQTTIFRDIPDVVAIAIDTVVGFPGGYGGKTGSDSIKILKSDIVSWPDTVGIGGYSLTFQKYNNAAYKAVVGTNIVIAGMIPNPGPTDLVGTYTRTANGVVIELKKVFNGVYVIDNPGGAGVPPFPYLFYNYASSTGGDSLSFPNQVNPCGGGLQLVGPTAPLSLVSKEYTATYPPAITATNPLTFQWRVFEFPSASPNSAHTGAALCQWGTGVRTFVKN
ncbi:MAG TPA: hypothetical protein VFX48_06210 [Saprospiraceae bacterium]|nr:hypothetical protein [Saprospiraceae bacterium]